MGNAHFPSVKPVAPPLGHGSNPVTPSVLKEASTADFPSKAVGPTTASSASLAPNAGLVERRDDRSQSDAPSSAAPVASAAPSVIANSCPTAATHDWRSAFLTPCDTTRMHLLPGIHCQFHTWTFAAMPKAGACFRFFTGHCGPPPFFTFPTFLNSLFSDGPLPFCTFPAFSRPPVTILSVRSVFWMVVLCALVAVVILMSKVRISL